MFGKSSSPGILRAPCNRSSPSQSPTIRGARQLVRAFQGQIGEVVRTPFWSDTTFLDQVLVAWLELSPADALLPRVLRDDTVWRQGMRDQVVRNVRDILVVRQERFDQLCLLRAATTQIGLPLGFGAGRQQRLAARGGQQRPADVRPRLEPAERVAPHLGHVDQVTAGPAHRGTPPRPFPRRCEARDLVREMEVLGRRMPTPVLHAGFGYARPPWPTTRMPKSFTGSLAADPDWTFDGTRLRLATASGRVASGAWPPRARRCARRLVRRVRRFDAAMGAALDEIGLE
jgi:hypothetical protein